MKMTWINRLSTGLIICYLAVGGGSGLVQAQQANESAPEQASTTTSADAQSANEPTSEVIERLEYIQDALTQKLAERSEIGEQIEQANEQDKEDLRARADDIGRDIAQLRSTIESIATGGADASMFSSEEPEEDVDTNWQEDVSLIARPVIDSLKELTEKPRRINALNEQIAGYQREFEEAELALDNLQPKARATDDADLAATLDRLIKVWNDRRDDAEASIKIARIEIAELQGDKSFFQTILDVVVEFVTGRGLTILLAIVAGMAVWFGLKFLLKGYRQSLVDKRDTESRTRYRLIEYSTHALTVLMILIAIFIVFYQRGDVLLLGLLILLLVGLALAARNFLPRYMAEARLLLNIGPMRESERVIYRDLPWRVESINMYTILRNPDLHGVLRVPISELHGVISRPSAKDPWFPTSRGDVILLDDTWLEVVSQNPDTVTVAERGGQTRNYPSTEFYQMSMTNLTRTGKFGVKESFGVDYDLQSISTTEVPKALRDAIREALEESDLGEFLKDLRVELSLAGASSLDYWILATFDSRAARSYPRIGRIIQGACVECCTERDWGIPFQHVTLVYKDADGSPVAAVEAGQV